MSKRVTIMGVRYPSIAEACRTYDIDPHIVYNRTHHLGWGLEVAITTPVNSHTRSVFFEGKLYKSLRELSSEYDIAHHVLIRRLCDGWSIEDAVTTPISPKVSSKGIKVCIRGVQYPSIARAAKSYNRRPGLVYRRIQTGWSVEDAVTTPVKIPRKDKWIKS